MLLFSSNCCKDSNLMRWKILVKWRYYKREILSSMIKAYNMNRIYVHAQTDLYIVQNLQLMYISEDKSWVVPAGNVAHSVDLQSHCILIPPLLLFKAKVSQLQAALIMVSHVILPILKGVVMVLFNPFWWYAMYHLPQLCSFSCLLALP